MNQSAEVTIRTVLAFFWLLIYTKWIGRQLITHHSHHMFVLSIVLGTIGGNMAFNIKVPLSYFLLSLVIISGIGYVMMLLSLKSKKAGRIISGEPVVMIKDGILLEDNMSKCKYSLEALKRELRSKEIFDPEEVEYAVLENDGNLSVMRKPAYRAVTVKVLQSYLTDRHPPE